MSTGATGTSATAATGTLGGIRRRVGEGLFPPAGEEGPRFSRGEGALVIGLFLLIATVLSVLRLGTDGYRTIWAEDATVFMESAFTHGFWPSIFEPYAGYLNVVPRLIGGFGTVIPLQDAAAVIAVLSAFCAALSGLAVWFGSAGHVRDPWLRGGLAIATALAATAGQETLDSAAYVPWFMLIGAFWLLFLRPKTWWGAVAASAFLVLTGLSTPGVWFFAPVGFLRLLALSPRREPRTALVAAGWLAGGLAQIPVILGQDQGTTMWSRHIWTALVQRVIDGGIFGQRMGGGFWDVGGWKFLLVLLIVLAIALVLGLRRAPFSTRLFVPLTIAIAFGMFMFSAYQRSIGPSIFWSPGTSGGTASRYVLVPSILFLSAFVALLDGAFRDRLTRDLRSRWPALAGTALMILAVAVSFDMTYSARSKPYWSEALRHSANKCITKHEEFAGIETSPAPFGLVVSCYQVEQFASPGVRERAGG
jgi:hypothetical protein